MIVLRIWICHVITESKQIFSMFYTKILSYLVILDMYLILNIKMWRMATLQK